MREEEIEKEEGGGSDTVFGEQRGGGVYQPSQRRVQYKWVPRSPAGPFLQELPSSALHDEEQPPAQYFLQAHQY